MARMRTLAQLRTEVRQRADMENSQFVSDAEVDRYLNEAISELYELIWVNAGQEFFLKTHTFQIRGGQDTYFLPSDLLSVLGVDADVGAPRPIEIRPYNFYDRHRFKGIERAWYRAYDLRYRLLGTIHDDSDPTSDALNPGLTLGTIDLIAGGPDPAPYIIDLTNNDPVNHFYAGQIVHSYNSFGTFIGEGTVLGTRVPATGANQLLVSGDAAWFVAGAGDTIHLANQGDYVPRIRFTPDTIPASSVTIWYVPHAPVLSEDDDVWNGFNGWEEYAIVDAAIRCLDKEESDTTRLMERKLLMVERIRSRAWGRDHGFGETLKDVYNRFERY